MATCVVVVIPKGFELSFQIPIAPEWDVIEKLATNPSDEPFNEWMRKWYLRNGLELVDFQNTKVCFPAVKLKQRVVIRTQESGCFESPDDTAEHLADSGTVRVSTMYCKPDDPPREKVRIVAGFSTIAERSRRVGWMKATQKLATT